MSFPGVASTSFPTGSGTNAVLSPLPTGIQVGDLLIAVVGHGAGIASAPAGWTLLGTLNQNGFGATFYRFATGSDGLTLPGLASEEAVGVIHRVTGAHATTPPEAIVNPALLGLAPSWQAEDTLWMAPAWSVGSAPSSNPLPPGFGTIAENGVTTTSGDMFVGSARIQWPDGVLSYDETWGDASNLIAIRPAVTATYNARTRSQRLLTTVNTTSHVITLPAGVVAGEYVVVVTRLQGSEDPITWPSGWTELQTASTSTQARRVSIGARLMDGTEGASITLTHGGVLRTGFHRAYRISAPGPLVLTSAPITSGDASNANPPALTPFWDAEDQATWWLAIGDMSQNALTAPPTNYVALHGQNSLIATARRLVPVATEDPGFFPGSTAPQWFGATVAIGEFTLIPITLTVDPGQGKVYGDADPTLLLSVTSGALAPGHTITSGPTRAAGEVPGVYAISQTGLVIHDGVKEVTGQYDITFVPANFTIVPRPITVEPKGGSKIEGDVDPVLEVAVTSGSLAFSDTITGVPVRAPGEVEGEYAITQGTVTITSSPESGDIANYDFTFIDGTFFIFPVGGPAPPANDLTARLFSAGRPRVQGRWAELQRQVGGTGPWETVDRRLISRVTSESPTEYVLELAEAVSPFETILWERSSDIQLMPLGLSRAWHLLPAAGVTDPTTPETPGKVLAVSGDFLQIATQPVAVGRPLLEVVRDDILPAPSPTPAGNFAALRLEAGGADRTVVSFGALAAASIDDVLGTWIGDPPILPPAVWIAWPGHSFLVNDNVGPLRLYWPAGVPTSATTPKLIGPAIDRVTGEVLGRADLSTIARDVLDGVYGGDPILFDSAAISALATLTDEGEWYVLSSPMSRGEFLQRAVWAPYLVAPFRMGGILTPRPIWPGDAVTTDLLYRFDLSTATTPLSYEYGTLPVRSLWRATYQAGDIGVLQEGAPLRDLILTERQRSAALPGRPLIAFELDQEFQVLRRVWADAFRDLFSERVFALAGDGVQEYTIGGIVEADAPEPGELVVLDLTQLRGPNPGTALRSGTRVALVVERRRVYGVDTFAYQYRLWDAGLRAHSEDHSDASHADTHSDSAPHADYHLDAHVDVHADVLHSDTHTDSTAHQDAHGDSTSHTDTHLDVHQDAVHDDVHGDSSHGDTHADSTHSDTHGDATGHRTDELDPHCDTVLATGVECFHDDVHSDHADHADQHNDATHDDTHTDSGHADGHADQHGDDPGHTDTHSDAAEGGTHSDLHGDNLHVDAHSDITHQDSHQDGSHVDTHNDFLHTDWHSDEGHADFHSDSLHTDTHGDGGHGDEHGDAHDDIHSDEPHLDGHLDGEHQDDHSDVAGAPSHEDTHDDITHEDTHDDTHTDIPHADSHQDTHIDDHGDQSHGDDHTDVTGFKSSDFDLHCDAQLVLGIPCHEDVHADGHNDTEHGDDHSDVPHQDGQHDDQHADDHGDQEHIDDHADVIQHEDAHADATHGDIHDDSPHNDTHTDSGPHSDFHSDSIHTDDHSDVGHTDNHDDATHGDGHRDQEHADAHADVRN